MAVPEKARGAGWLLLCLLVTTGCGSAARRSAGATVMALGGLTSYAGVHVMIGGCTDVGPTPRDRARADACQNHQQSEPQTGAMVLTAGLTTLVAGGILFASGIRYRSAAPPVSKP